MKTLEEIYSVPKLVQINSEGDVLVKFSSPIIKLDFQELITSFIYLDQNEKERILQSERDGIGEPIKTELYEEDGFEDEEITEE